MKKFTLYCRGEGGKEGEWRFQPAGDGVNVTDADGKVVGRVPHAEAGDRFLLPSFWRSIKNIGLQLPDGKTVWFTPDREDVAAVKRHLDAALAWHGPEGVQRLRKRGGLHVLGGLGLVVLGFVLLGFFRWLFGGERRAGLAGLAAVILAGIAETAWGVSALVRARRVRRLLDEVRDD
jgi:hypothetical protein